MSIRIGDHKFEYATYDELGDVLYLRNTEPQRVASTTYATPEGHAVRLEANGRIVGMTIVNARWLVEREGEIVISIPKQRIEVPAQDVNAALEHSISR